MSVRGCKASGRCCAVAIHNGYLGQCWYRLDLDEDDVFGRLMDYRGEIKKKKEGPDLLLKIGDITGKGGEELGGNRGHIRVKAITPPAGRQPSKKQLWTATMCLRAHGGSTWLKDVNRSCRYM